MRATHVVTGAFGNSGRRIACRLLESNVEVITLTQSADRGTLLAERVPAFPLAFADPAGLVRAMRGASVLYNTYWVRFNYGSFSHAQAVKNSRILIDAACEAGVRRIVHVSITNPRDDSPLEYFKGKAMVERAIMESGLSYAILRPAVLFGGRDVLINNIAWMLRTFPVFGVFGDGTYRLRPVHVDDLARLAVAQGAGSDNRVIDAVGPETFAFRDLVDRLGRIIGYRRPIVPVSPTVGYAIGRAIGWILGDILVTREEIDGLMVGLLDVSSPTTGQTKLSEWAQQHLETLGMYYASELQRRCHRTVATPSVIAHRKSTAQASRPK